MPVYRPKRTSFLLLLVIALQVITVTAQKKPAVYYPKPGNWEHRSSAAVGMDSALLQEAVQFAVKSESKELRDLKKAHYLSAFGREPFGYLLGPMKDSAPATAFAHVGAGTNMIYVDQENDIIIVARWIQDNACDGLIQRVLKSIQK